jgi:hypothetical protein
MEEFISGMFASFPSAILLYIFIDRRLTKTETKVDILMEDRSNAAKN